MQPVLGLIEDRALLPIQHLVADLDVAIGRERMHVNGIVFGQPHLGGVGDPIGVPILDAFPLGRIRRRQQWSPGLGVDDFGTREACLHVLHDFE